MHIMSENKSLKELSQILGFENVQTDAKIERIIFDSKMANNDPKMDQNGPQGVFF